LSDVSAQAAFEEKVRRAAALRDPVGMLQAMAEHGLVERLERKVERKYDRLDAEDARWIVATSVESLYERLAAEEEARANGRSARKDGREVKNASNWLYKTVENKAQDLSDHLLHRVSLDDWDEEGEEFNPLETEEQRDRRREEAAAALATRRRKLFEVAKGLVPRIPGFRARQVMSLIFEAWEKGVVDLTNEEIAARLGIKKNTAAQAKCRGRDALIALAKEERLTGFDVSMSDLELTDDEEALAAPDEEEEL
jgi:hypothetical protein